MAGVINILDPDVIVLGGGTAGFLSALTLKLKLPHLRVRVVRSRETTRDLRKGVEDRARASLGLAQPRAERRPLDQLHRDEHLVPHLADLVHRDDVRMR